MIGYIVGCEWQNRIRKKTGTAVRVKIRCLQHMCEPHRTARRRGCLCELCPFPLFLATGEPKANNSMIHSSSTRTLIASISCDVQRSVILLVPLYSSSTAKATPR